jgi:hypothetical protein
VVKERLDCEALAHPLGSDSDDDSSDSDNDSSDSKTLVAANFVEGLREIADSCPNKKQQQRK